MKITKQDYNKLKKAILSIDPDILATLKNMSRNDTQHRWNVYHFVNAPPTFLFRYLHEYLNDNHIDTALRTIIK